MNKGVGEPDPPDDQLIAQIAGGDREAFAELYRRHRPDICRSAAHMCGSTSAAEDIVHEAFVAVMIGLNYAKILEQLGSGYSQV